MSKPEYHSEYYIGLISGTSIDGVDCVLVEFSEEQPTLIASHFSPTPSALKERTLQLCQGSNIDLQLFGQIDVELGRVFAEGVAALLAKAGVDASEVKAIGSHGQTVWHQPHGEFPFTLQIADPNVIAQQTGITTIGDMRRRDVAAGGQGAPIAPLLHRNCFSSETENRIILNVGGFSNITLLETNGSCAAFDTGPGNVLMDYWIAKHRNEIFDADGNWARSGIANAALLEQLLDEGYFQLPHPKSTGRELFNGPWLENKLQQFGNETDPSDVQATLLKFTVKTIAADISKLISPDKIYVCGGGAHNGALMDKLQQEFTEAEVASTAGVGIAPDWVEAIAFAWMAKQTLAGIAIDTSAFTGATEPVILGGIYQA